MTPQEFKAWFDGFTEAFSGVPTKAQWQRIKERVGEIDGKPVTERIYVDRYWPIYNQYPRYYPSWTAAGQLTSAGIAGQVSSQNYDSLAALYNLGRNDAKDLAS